MSEESVEVSSEPVVSDSTSEEASTESLETQEPIEGDIEVSSEEGSAEEAESAPEQLFSITVDGEELELTHSQMIEFAQKGKASVKRFQEAAQLKKEVAAKEAAIRAAIQGSPEDLFNLKIQNGLMTGEDLEQWIIQKALEIAERPELSPEEIKLQEMEKELEELRKGKEAEEKAKQDAAYQAEVEQHKEQFSADIMSAISAGGLETDPFTVKQVAAVMMDAMDVNGELTISAQDAVEYVKSLESNTYLDYIKSLDPDKLADILGEEKLSKIRAKDLEKIKNPMARPVNPLQPSKSSEPAKKLSATEFFKNLGN